MSSEEQDHEYSQHRERSESRRKSKFRESGSEAELVEVAVGRRVSTLFDSRRRMAAQAKKSRSGSAPPRLEEEAYPVGPGTVNAVN